MHKPSLDLSTPDDPLPSLNGLAQSAFKNHSLEVIDEKEILPDLIRIESELFSEKEKTSKIESELIMLRGEMARLMELAGRSEELAAKLEGMQEQLSSAVTDKESTESLYNELKTQHTLLLQSHEQLRKDLVHTSSGRENQILPSLCLPNDDVPNWSDEPASTSSSEKYSSRKPIDIRNTARKGKPFLEVDDHDFDKRLSAPPSPALSLHAIPLIEEQHITATSLYTKPHSSAEREIVKTVQETRGRPITAKTRKSEESSYLRSLSPSLTISAAKAAIWALSSQRSFAASNPTFTPTSTSAAAPANNKPALNLNESEIENAAKKSFLYEAQLNNLTVDEAVTVTARQALLAVARKSMISPSGSEDFENSEQFMQMTRRDSQPHFLSRKTSISTVIGPIETNIKRESSTSTSADEGSNPIVVNLPIKKKPPAVSPSRESINRKPPLQQEKPLRTKKSAGTLNQAAKITNLRNKLPIVKPVESKVKPATNRPTTPIANKTNTRTGTDRKANKKPLTKLKIEEKAPKDSTSVVTRTPVKSSKSTMATLMELEEEASASVVVASPKETSPTETPPMKPIKTTEAATVSALERRGEEFISRGVSPIKQESIKSRRPSHSLKEASPVEPVVRLPVSRKSILDDQRNSFFCLESPSSSTDAHPTPSPIALEKSLAETPVPSNINKDAAPIDNLIQRATKLLKRFEAAEAHNLNKQLRRNYEPHEMTNLGNQIIDNALMDIEVLPDHFRYLRPNTRKNRTLSSCEVISIAPGEEEEVWKWEHGALTAQEAEADSKSNDLTISRAQFLSMVHFIGTLLTKIGDMRAETNEILSNYLCAVNERSKLMEKLIDYENSIVPGTSTPVAGHVRAHSRNTSSSVFTMEQSTLDSSRRPSVAPSIMTVTTADMERGSTDESFFSNKPERGSKTWMKGKWTSFFS